MGKRLRCQCSEIVPCTPKYDIVHRGEFDLTSCWTDSKVEFDTRRPPAELVIRIEVIEALVEKMERGVASNKSNEQANQPFNMYIYVCCFWICWMNNCFYSSPRFTPPASSIWISLATAWSWRIKVGHQYMCVCVHMQTVSNTVPYGSLLQEKITKWISICHIQSKRQKDMPNSIRREEYYT